MAKTKKAAAAVISETNGGGEPPPVTTPPVVITPTPETAPVAKKASKKKAAAATQEKAGEDEPLNFAQASAEWKRIASETPKAERIQLASPETPEPKTATPEPVTETPYEKWLRETLAERERIQQRVTLRLTEVKRLPPEDRTREEVIEARLRRREASPDVSECLRSEVAEIARSLARDGGSLSPRLLLESAEQLREVAQRAFGLSVVDLTKGLEVQVVIDVIDGGKKAKKVKAGKTETPKAGASPETLDLGRKVIALREKGETWEKLAKALGITGARASYAMRAVRDSK